MSENVTFTHNGFDYEIERADGGFDLWRMGDDGYHPFEDHLVASLPLDTAKDDLIERAKTAIADRQGPIPAGEKVFVGSLAGEVITRRDEGEYLIWFDDGDKFAYPRDRICTYSETIGRPPTCKA